MASHTPGPWNASKVVDGAITAKSDPRSNLLGLDKDGYAIFMNPTDAVMAAAAPELLQALKDTEWSNGGFCPQCDRGPKKGHQPKCLVGNAIAKAEGK